MTNKKTNAFSLLELAIVMIIIGLLAVGITGGQRLIKKANLSRARMFTSSSPVPAIDGLELWLESSLNDSFVMSGSEVATWVDLSSSNNNANTIEEIGRPTIIKNDDGLPLVTFDGNAPALITSNSVGVYTVYIVANIDTETDAASSVLDASTVAVSGTHKINKTGDGSQFLTDGIYRVNGVVSTTGKIFTDGWGIYGYESASALGTDILKIMESQAGAPAKGGVAEIIVYNRDLDTDETNDIETYLSKKYKIAI